MENRYSQGWIPWFGSVSSVRQLWRLARVNVEELVIEMPFESVTNERRWTQWIQFKKLSKFAFSRIANSELSHNRLQSFFFFFSWLLLCVAFHLFFRQLIKDFHDVPPWRWISICNFNCVSSNSNFVFLMSSQTIKNTYLFLSLPCRWSGARSAAWKANRTHRTESDKSTDKIMVCTAIAVDTFIPRAHCTHRMHISMQTYFVCLHFTESPRLLLCFCPPRSSTSFLISFHAFFAGTVRCLWCVRVWVFAVGAHNSLTRSVYKFQVCKQTVDGKIVVAENHRKRPSKKLMRKKWKNLNKK